MKRTAGEVFEMLCKFQAISLETFQGEVADRYTDWKLYLQCAAQISTDATPFVKASTVPVAYDDDPVLSSLPRWEAGR